MTAPLQAPPDVKGPAIQEYLTWRKNKKPQISYAVNPAQQQWFQEAIKPAGTGVGQMGQLWNLFGGKIVSSKKNLVDFGEVDLKDLDPTIFTDSIKVKAHYDKHENKFYFSDT